MAVYTLGLWTVHEGREDDFVKAWTEMAERTKEEFPNASGTLLRDHNQPGLFISFGPWSSEDEVSAWRASAPFVEGVAATRATLMSFEPHTMDLVTRVG